MMSLKYPMTLLNKVLRKTFNGKKLRAYVVFEKLDFFDFSPGC